MPDQQLEAGMRAVILYLFDTNLQVDCIHAHEAPLVSLDRTSILVWLHLRTLSENLMITVLLLVCCA